MVLSETINLGWIQKQLRSDNCNYSFVDKLRNLLGKCIESVSSSFRIRHEIHLHREPFLFR